MKKLMRSFVLLAFLFFKFGATSIVIGQVEIPCPDYSNSNTDWWLYQFQGYPDYTNHNCGPASAAMVINYLKNRGITTTYHEVISIDYPDVHCYARWNYCQGNGHHGDSTWFENSDWSVPGAKTAQIQNALSFEGIESRTLTGYDCLNDGTGINNIQNALDQGKPCICLVAPMYYRDDVTEYFSHWITVYGYDDNHIYLNDPGYRTGQGFKANKSDFGNALWKVQELSTIIIVEHTNINSDLVAYYPFNGNANDESGHDNDGSVYGATLTTDRFGNADFAFKFDGLDDYIKLDQNLDFDHEQEQTISTWIKVDTIIGYRGTIFSSANSGIWPFGQYLLFIYDSYQVQYHVRYRENFNQILITDERINNAWNLITVSKDSLGILRAYINGQLVEIFESSPGFNTPDVYFETVIGAYRKLDGYTNFFCGSIDDIRIYKRALSDGEVQTLYSEITEVTKSSTMAPSKYSLYQNYPNPFNSSTVISYTISNPGFVTLEVYDLLGREVQTLVEKFQETGIYSVNFHSDNIPSGIYYYKLKLRNNFIETKKMLLIR
ncbi:MAG: LamG-like jellyroll fold domain-containing protein [candidate division KSB1 bacterium]|nr:LamG-like jellyroll fold domain-containing protein [candidate division KSB1 bacterium]